MHLSKQDKKYWQHVLIERENAPNIEAAISRDGLLYLFDYTDIEHCTNSIDVEYHSGDLRVIVKTSKVTEWFPNAQFVSETGEVI